MTDRVKAPAFRETIRVKYVERPQQPKPVTTLRVTYVERPTSPKPPKTLRVTVRGETPSAEPPQLLVKVTYRSLNRPDGAIHDDGPLTPAGEGSPIVTAATAVFICDLCGAEFAETTPHGLCPTCEQDAAAYRAKHPEWEAEYEAWARSGEEEGR